MFPCDATRELAKADGVLLTTRCKSLRLVLVGTSDSSLELEDEWEGVYVGDGRDNMLTWRSNDTVIVASEAISRARLDDRGFVVKTTKKGIDPGLWNVDGSGKVT